MEFPGRRCAPAPSPRARVLPGEAMERRVVLQESIAAGSADASDSSAPEALLPGHLGVNLGGRSFVMVPAASAFPKEPAELWWLAQRIAQQIATWATRFSTAAALHLLRLPPP